MEKASGVVPKQRSPRNPYYKEHSLRLVLFFIQLSPTRLMTHSSCEPGWDFIIRPTQTIFGLPMSGKHRIRLRENKRICHPHLTVESLGGSKVKAPMRVGLYHTTQQGGGELKPCQKGYRCLWGNAHDGKVVCSRPRCCVRTVGPGKYEDTAVERLMSSANTYERRGGKVRQRRHASVDD